MQKSRCTQAQRVAMLRQADRGSVAEAARKHRGGAQSVDSWRQRFGALEPADSKRLRDLEYDVMKEINRRKRRARGRVASRSRSMTGAGRSVLPVLAMKAPSVPSGVGPVVPCTMVMSGLVRGNARMPHHIARVRTRDAEGFWRRSQATRTIPVCHMTLAVRREAGPRASGVRAGARTREGTRERVRVPRPVNAPPVGFRTTRHGA